jgi:NAD(P)-dependent dehydrogenase (short-subunit alcohol dehydrogenase family)
MSQSEIRALVDRFRTVHGRLDVLINNAGAIFSQREVTSEGFERTWALNHNAYFLLTTLLQDLLVESAPARVVNTASDAHQNGRMYWDDLQFAKRRPLWGWRSYSQSKLANVLFTRQLAHCLKGSKVTANAIHPGFVNTGFSRNNGPLARAMMVLTRPIQRQDSKGAETVVWAAISEEAEGITGQYLYDCKPKGPSKNAKDVAAGARLWDLSEGMTATRGAWDGLKL